MEVHSANELMKIRGAYYAVWNTGANMAEAINFTGPGWGPPLFYVACSGRCGNGSPDQITTAGMQTKAPRLLDVVNVDGEGVKMKNCSQKEGSKKGGLKKGGSKKEALKSQEQTEFGMIALPTPMRYRPSEAHVWVGHGVYTNVVHTYEATPSARLRGIRLRGARL